MSSLKESHVIRDRQLQVDFLGWVRLFWVCACALLIQVFASALGNGYGISAALAEEDEHSPFSHDLSPAIGNPRVHERTRKPNEVAKIQAELDRTKNIQRALDQLQALLAREPENVEAHMMCGKVLQLLGYESLADEQYRLVDKLDPTQPTSILALFQNKLESQGPLAASEYLQYVQRRFPKDPSVLLMQGMVERMHGQDIKAEFYYREAMDKNPNTQGLATALAAVRLSQKRYREAIEIAEHDIKLKKDHPAANLAKAQAYMALGQFDKAIPCLKIAYEGLPDKKGVSDALSRVLIKNGQFGDAIEPTLVCLSLISMKDKRAVEQMKLRLLLIVSHVGTGELMNSLEIAKRKIHFKETMANLYFASGDVLERAGKLKDAEKCFENGITMLPYSGRPYLRLGILQEQRGDYQAAMRSYNQADQLSPDDREVAARFVRLIKRAPAQEYDIAWRIKDLLRGGRKSQFYDPNRSKGKEE